MKIVMVYISPNGTTRRTVRELGKRFSRTGHDFTEFDIGGNGNRDISGIDWNVFRGADILGIAAPVYHLRLFDAMERFLDDALPRIREKNLANGSGGAGSTHGTDSVRDGAEGGIRAFVVVTYAGITSGRALPNTARLLRKNGIPLCGAMKIRAPHFWHTEGYPDEEGRGMIAEFQKELDRKDYRPIPWKRARRALSRPKPIIRVIYPFSGIIGKKRNQPIRIAEERCTACGRCVRECPVGAVSMNGIGGISTGPRISRDEKKCAYCYHCVTVCPRGAVLCDIEKVKSIVERNRKIVGLEQPSGGIFV